MMKESESDIVKLALANADPVQRQAYLDVACKDEPELRARVETRLAADNLAASNPDLSSMQLRHSLADVEPQPTAELSSLAGTDASAEFDFDDPDTAVARSNLSAYASNPNHLGGLAHYQVVKAIGRGAYGTVFEAFDEVLHRPVAIKVLDPRLATSPVLRQRFLREARAAAAVRHENTVQIYGVTELPSPYLVMEYIDGETLADYLRRCGQLDVPLCVLIGKQIAAGLNAAHSQGLVHRDIKPSNILLSKDPLPQVKLTDFGLARSVDDVGLTRSGVIVGTPLYMSPEQALGNVIDHRSDLYSLGSVLYEMAAGRPPFQASTTLAVLRQVTEEAAQPVSQNAHHVPDWLCELIQKLHAKLPEDRIQSASEVVDRLIHHQTQLGTNVSEVQTSPGLTFDKNSTTASVSPGHSDGGSARERGRRSATGRWVAAASVVVPTAVLTFTEASGITQYLRTAASRDNGLHSLNKDSGQTPVSQDAAETAAATEPTNTSGPESSKKPALRFAGEGQVSVPSLRSLPDRSGPYTIEAFITSESEHLRHANLVDFDNQAVLRISSDQQRITFTTYHGREKYKIDADATATIGRRMHVAAVSDATTIRIFVDGNLVTRVPNQSLPLDDSDELSLGRHFTGLIDWIRISDSARYTDNFVPTTKIDHDRNTLAVYEFAEATEGVLRDSTGNGHHGTILGAQWVMADGSASNTNQFTQQQPTKRAE